jgi:hypothetical protein
LGLYEVSKTQQGSIPHSVIDDVGFYRDNLILKTFVEGNEPFTHFTEGWINIDLSPNNNAVADPVSGNAGLLAGITGEQGLTSNLWNFWFQPASGTNFQGFRGLPVIGGVLTEVTHAGLGLNYRTAIPWASAVHWPYTAGNLP